MFVYITTTVMPPFIIIGLAFMLAHEIYKYMKGDE